MSTLLPGLPTLYTAEEIADMLGRDRKAFRAFLRRRGHGYMAITKTNLRLTQEDVDELLGELHEKPQAPEPTGLDIDRERVKRQRQARQATRTTTARTRSNAA